MVSLDLCISYKHEVFNGTGRIITNKKDWDYEGNDDLTELSKLNYQYYFSHENKQIWKEQKANFFDNEIDEVYKRISQCGELYYGEEFLNLNETDPDFEDLDYKKYMFTWDDRSVFTGLFSNFGF